MEHDEKKTVVREILVDKLDQYMKAFLESKMTELDEQILVTMLNRMRKFDEMMSCQNTALLQKMNNEFKEQFERLKRNRARSLEAQFSEVFEAKLSNLIRNITERCEDCIAEVKKKFDERYMIMEARFEEHMVQSTEKLYDLLKDKCGVYDDMMDRCIVKAEDLVVTHMSNVVSDMTSDGIVLRVETVETRVGALEDVFRHVGELVGFLKSDKKLD